MLLKFWYIIPKMNLNYISNRSMNKITKLNLNKRIINKKEEGQ